VSGERNGPDGTADSGTQEPVEMGRLMQPRPGRFLELEGLSLDVPGTPDLTPLPSVPGDTDLPPWS